MISCAVIIYVITINERENKTNKGKNKRMRITDRSNKIELIHKNLQLSFGLDGKFRTQMKGKPVSSNPLTSSLI